VEGNTTLSGSVSPIQDVATDERDQVPVKEPAWPRNLDTEATVKTSIPTLIFCGSGAQAEPENCSPRAQGFDNVAI